MREWRVMVTDADVQFVETARKHYKVLAEALEAKADPEEQRTAGIMRGQEFYAERFLLRLTTEVR